MGKRKGLKANVAVTEVSGKTTPQLKSPGVQKKLTPGQKEAGPSSKGFIDDLFSCSKKASLPGPGKQSKPDTSTAGKAATNPKACLNLYTWLCSTRTPSKLILCAEKQGEKRRPVWTG